MFKFLFYNIHHIGVNILYIHIYIRKYIICSLYTCVLRNLINKSLVAPSLQKLKYIQKEKLITQHKYIVLNNKLFCLLAKYWEYIVCQKIQFCIKEIS
jgi:hypothetical protein